MTTRSKKSPQEVEGPLQAKVVLLGAQGVGKTSLVLRRMGQEFQAGVTPTIGASYTVCLHEIQDQIIKLQIWDTAGQERFRAMAPMYYRNADAAFIVYDVTNFDSLPKAKSWAKEILASMDRPPVLCLLGNKTDLEHLRMIPTADGRRIADEIGAEFVETSAAQNKGIDEAFEKLARAILNRPPDPDREWMYSNSLSSNGSMSDSHTKNGSWFGGCCGS